MLIDAVPSDPQPQDLGTIEFFQLDNLEPNAGDLWYRFTALRDGVLTAELAGVELPQGEAIRLHAYDNDGNPQEL